MLRKIIHGRESTATPVEGTDGLLYVIFHGEGPLPDYDIGNWEHDRPIGGGDILRTKITRDYSHYADALLRQERELFKKKDVRRERGALYLLQDKASGKWAVWLETWPNYFARSHTLKSPEMAARETAELQARLAKEAALRDAAALAHRNAELAKPSTWILLALGGVLVIWELIRLVEWALR